MQTETITMAEYEILVKRAKSRKRNGPVIIQEMTEAQRASFALDIETIRKRGMYR